MTGNGTLQILLYLTVLLLLVKPLGLYMARVFTGTYSNSTLSMGRFENFIYRICRIDPKAEMNWKIYLIALLLFNFLGIIFLYALQRLQAYLPFNPQQFLAPTPDLAFNNAAGFATNTDWQAYGGESTFSYWTQMFGFTVQNFLSAATGMTVLLALIRGLARSETTLLGNFWVDLVRSVIYILLPLSLLLAFILMSQGVIQNFKPYQSATLIQPLVYQDARLDSAGNPVLDLQGNAMTDPKTLTTQTIPMGPVASMEAIKQLGTNGGGFFNANSAHPYENPTPLSNFLEMLAILLIPAALCYTYGFMVGDTRQGWAILATMLIILVPLMFLATSTEQHGNPALTQLGVSAGGNMEGKETRFGIVNSTLWTVASTGTANGSVNSMLDSYMPLSGLIPLWLIQLGEVIFGGVGTGLAGMLIYVLLTVFVAGLMVGRTPEYLGKKIEPYEMKMTSFVVLIMPLIILILTAISSVTQAGISSVANPGAHGFTEILYAFSSMTENNGSAFAGLNANTPYYNFFGGIAILLGRYWMAVPILAIAGALARKKTVPVSLGTLPTNTLLFIILLVCLIIVVGALTFLPALALGPVVEHLMLRNLYVS
jgi:potassium-transporting ATPase potassium-binding subunit